MKTSIRLVITVITSGIIDQVHNASPISGILAGHAPSSHEWLGSGSNLSKHTWDHSKFHHLQNQINKTESKGEGLKKITENLLPSAYSSLPFGADNPQEALSPIDHVIFQKLSHKIKVTETDNNPRR